MKRINNFFGFGALFLCGVVLCTQMNRNALRTQGKHKKEGVHEYVCDSICEERGFLPLMSFVDSIGKHPPTMHLIDSVIRVLPLEHKDIVLAQVALESAYATSTMSKANNNLVAMRVAKQRATLNSGEKSGYAMYKNWAYSLLDYALWQDRYMKGLNREQYMEKLSKVYATDSAYIEKISKIINKF